MEKPQPNVRIDFLTMVDVGDILYLLRLAETHSAADQKEKLRARELIEKIEGGFPLTFRPFCEEK